MENTTIEQQQFDGLVRQINDDLKSYPQMFSKISTAFRMLFHFESDRDAIIQLSTSDRIITFGSASGDFTIIDADYVEDKRNFNHRIGAFEQFYRTEKEATVRHLASVGISVEPEVEPYSLAWLQNPENANWELHWFNDLDKEDEQYESQDLYHTHDGEFVLHEYRASDGREVVQRNLSDEAVKTFVYEKFQDPVDILQRMGIEVAETIPPSQAPVSLSVTDRVRNKIENEYFEFKENMKEQTKDELMRAENVYEILVKSEIVDHVLSEDISDELAGVLLESENMLEDIYDEYTAKDSHEFSRPIQMAINDYVDRHKEVVENMEVEIFDNEEIETDGYVEVEASVDGFVSVDELDADGVGNMKKHKARTAIRDFGVKGLE